MSRRSGGMADATDSKSVGSDTVWVQVPPSAPKNKRYLWCLLFFYFHAIKVGLEGGSHFTGVKCFALRTKSKMLFVGKVDNCQAGCAAKGASPPSARKWDL